MTSNDLSYIALSTGIFLGLMGLSLSLPDLNTFFVNFTEVGISYVRIFQYSLMITAFAYISRVIV